MNVGMVGLGKMGLNLALNMIDNKIEVYGFDKYITDEVKKEYNKIRYMSTLKELVSSLNSPRIVWVMVPSGDIAESVLDELSLLLDKGDILIDGGNSKYTDTLRRYNTFKERGVHLIDSGTSGGVYGARNGACLMVGGEKEIVKSIENLFVSVATKDGYAYMGAPGSGHFVKMVHNGIEYGMMQAIGEGFDLLNASQFDLNYPDVAKVWANGSIIEGMLMSTVLSAVSKDEKLESIEGRVDDSGEGQWTVEEALKLKVSTPVIAQALFSRYKSKDDTKFSEKVVAAMRNEFGGHKVYKKK
ncbi:decarboxylating 6-phosphogluconate dehydrogenase [Mycoplasmatota bacterium WC30]